MKKRISPSSSKKGVMGIETLIIFIAMILVAAVAAGVLLKTSGLLQQRSLAVGSEATERVVTGFEAISITANSNVTENTFNEMETTIRLQAGSYDMSLLSLSYIIRTPTFSHQADLQHTEVTSFQNKSVPLITNDTWVSIGNFDIDSDDTATDYVRLIHNISGNNDGLQFNFSSYGTINMSLGADIENGTLNVRNVPITQFNASTSHPPTFGFYTYTGNVSNTLAINTSESGGISYVANAPSDNGCTFDKLIDNIKFCMDIRIGDSDYVLESGELVVLRYKLSDDYTIEGDSDFDLQFVPKRGGIIDIAIYVPEVISRTVTTLWP